MTQNQSVHNVMDASSRVSSHFGNCARVGVIRRKDQSTLDSAAAAWQKEEEKKWGSIRLRANTRCMGTEPYVNGMLHASLQ